ncbi:multidrug ABC transporter ATP-binding protein [Paenibacillus sambharensis]|uniref:Multidrug ABC transporter ATP-binding protein n=1 Tax=Paenibacillus sambharensis TaxID=1803190 RepID=A0A2W1L630_9BACL|nr:multidrug ABC transporter ATP-binding protein [Paenibacillus sambharensis]
MAEPRGSMDTKEDKRPPMPTFGAGRARGPMVKVRARNTRATLVRLWKVLRQQRGGLLAVLLLVIGGAAASLAGPYLIGRAIDDFILQHDRSGLLRTCLILLLVYVMGAIVTWLQAYLMVGISGRTVWTMRRDLFGHLQKLPLRFFDKKTHGELMSRTTNDIENVSNTLNQSLVQLINSVMMLIGSLTMMLVLNVWLTIIAMVTIPLVMLTVKLIAARTRQQFANQQQHLGDLNGLIEETISGQKVVKMYNREDKVVSQFGAINGQLAAAGIRAQILSGALGPVNNMMSHFNYILLAVAGGWMTLNGYASIGIIVSFLTYSRQFSNPVNELANQYNMIQSGVAGAERVFEIMDESTEYEDDRQGEELGDVQGEVRFEQVTFRYGDNITLRDVSFTAKPGETIALVGPTGAGKTTVINLLTRFYEIESGAIRIDGRDIREVSKDSLRSRIGMVLQDAYLFAGTVKDNIRYGRTDASEEDIRRAAQLAGAEGFILKLPDSYDTVLHAEGGNLSQGQRQLLTIARAILADPAILIFDEATSSVDTRTEMQIQDAMNKLMHGRTSFVIAHRLSTIRNADQILFVLDGEIAERGTHDELLARGGKYYGLYANQLTQPETG